MLHGTRYMLYNTDIHSLHKICNRVRAIDKTSGFVQYLLTPEMLYYSTLPSIASTTKYARCIKLRKEKHPFDKARKVWKKQKENIIKKIKIIDQHYIHILQMSSHYKLF